MLFGTSDGGNSNSILGLSGMGSYGWLRLLWEGFVITCEDSTATAQHRETPGV